MHPGTVAACAVLLAGALLGEASAQIVRCQAADGGVVYSNSDCPPNTKLVRRIDQSPPVVVHDGARPAAKASERQPAAVERSRPRPAPDPLREDRELTEQLALQRQECESRARDLRSLQEELVAAPADSRAAAELMLRRAQEDYRALCPRQR
jgi:hypothetical protein